MTATPGSEVIAVATSQRWMELYKAALMEFDREKLPQRIEAAQRAIQARLRALAIVESKQRRELREALNHLTIIQNIS
jgi:hypothetical protein